MFTFYCSRCGRRLRVPDDWAGQLARCAACGSTIRAPILGEAVQAMTAPLDEEPEAGPDVALQRLAEAAREHVSSHRPMSRCPNCGTYNRFEAERCKECGKALYVTKGV